MPQYDNVSKFINGICAVKSRGKWGYIDKNNTMIIAPKFKKAWPFIGELARVDFYSKMAYINKSGAFVWWDGTQYTKLPLNVKNFIKSAGND